MSNSRAKRIVLAALLLALVGALGFTQAGATGDRRDEPRPRAYELTITSNVRRADIYIDGVRQREGTPATFRLRPDTYSIRIEARGYQTWQGRVTLDSDQTIRAELLPPTATVYLEVPSEFLNDRVRDPWRMIDFYIDGRLRTGSRIEVDSGYHDVTVASGGLQFESEFFFEAGRTYTLELIMRMSLYQSGR
jgi:hypothetical protein